MELLTIVRALLRRPMLLAVAAVPAVAVALALGATRPLSSATGSPAASGEALVRVLIDTRHSLTANVSAEGADTIQRRAVLLADLLQSDGVTADIARSAVVPQRDVLVLGPSSGVPVVDSRLALSAEASGVAGAGQPYVVTVFVNDYVPIISVGVAAPDTSSARRLATASVSTLTSLAEGDSGRTGLSIRPLGAVRTSRAVARETTRRPVALAAAAAVFLVSCAVGLVASRVLRTLRAGRSQPRAL